MRCRLTVAFAGVPTCYRSHVRVCLAITLYVRSIYSYVWHQCIEASLMQPGEKWKRTPQQGGGQYGSRNPGPTAILIIFDPSISTNTYEYVHINTCIHNMMLYAHVPYLRMYLRMCSLDVNARQPRGFVSPRSALPRAVSDIGSG